MKPNVPHPLRACVPPCVTLVAGLLIWQAFCSASAIPKVLLPSPAQILTAAFRNWPQLAEATGITAAAALAGLALSLISGTASAMVLSQSTWLRRGLFPYAIFLQTVPIVAIAPLIVIWLGEGFAAVVTIAFIVSFFPVMTNGTAGMLQVGSGRWELFRLYHASRWQTLLKLQLPQSLPMLVTGAKISSGLAVLGAIVGEYFAGSANGKSGLGYLIFTAKDQFELDTLFAAVLLCTLLGVCIFSALGALGERCLLGWVDRPKSAVEPE